MPSSFLLRSLVVPLPPETQLRDGTQVSGPTWTVSGYGTITPTVLACPAYGATSGILRWRIQWTTGTTNNAVFQSAGYFGSDGIRKQHPIVPADNTIYDTNGGTRSKIFEMPIQATPGGLRHLVLYGDSGQSNPLNTSTSGNFFSYALSPQQRSFGQ